MKRQAAARLSLCTHKPEMIPDFGCGLEPAMKPSKKSRITAGFFG
jgi:hypothetical protein